MKVHSVAFGNSHLRASETVSGMNCLLIITVIRNEQCRAGAMLIYLCEAPLTGGERVLSFVSPTPARSLRLVPKKSPQVPGRRWCGTQNFPNNLSFFSFFLHECWWLRDFSF